MDDSRLPLAIAPALRERLFPTLTPQQILRIAAHGRRRSVAEGEVLVEIGDRPVPFFVVASGAAEVVRPDGDQESVIVVHGPGHFSGEATMITGRRALSRVRMREGGEVIELD